MQDTPVITPLGNLRDFSQLVGAFVCAEIFDDPVFRHELYLGTIEEVKINKRGTFVHFKAKSGPSHIVGKKWIPLHKVTGWAHYAPTMQKATA